MAVAVAVARVPGERRASPVAAVKVMLSVRAVLPVVDAAVQDLLVVAEMGVQLKVAIGRARRQPASKLVKGGAARVADARDRRLPPVNDPVTTQPLSWRHDCVCRI
jgi:hypothetical protein